MITSSQQLDVLMADRSMRAFVPHDPELALGRKFREAQESIASSLLVHCSPRSHIANVNVVSAGYQRPQMFTEKGLQKFLKTWELPKAGHVALGSIEWLRQKLQAICLETLGCPKMIDRIHAIEKIANALFPHMTLAEQAKVKANADIIVACMRLNRELSDETAFNLDRLPDFVDDFYTSPFEYLAESLYDQIEKRSFLPEVVQWDLASSYLETLPEGLCQRLSGIKRLFFQNNEKASVALLTSIASLHTLEEIDLSGNDINWLPPCFFKDLPHLQKFIFKDNQCENIFLLSWLNQSTELKELDLSGNCLRTSCGADFSKLQKLEIFRFRGNESQNENLMTALMQARSLRELDLSGNKFENFPEDFVEKLPHLEILNLKGNPINKFRKDYLRTVCLIHNITLIL